MVADLPLAARLRASCGAVENPAVIQRTCSVLKAVESVDEQALYLALNCPESLVKFRELSGELSEMVWAFCAMTTTLRSNDSVLWIGSETQALGALDTNVSTVVIGDEKLGLGDAIQVSLMLVTSTHINVLRDVLKFLNDTSSHELDRNPLLLSTFLYQLVDRDESWQKLRQTCPHVGSGYQCLQPLCCSIRDESSEAVALTGRPLYPLHQMQSYQATVAVQRHEGSSNSSTPNFYALLEQVDSLPSDDCHACLRKNSEAPKCKEICKNFRDRLCSETVPSKFVGEEWRIRQPPLRRDPERIIPRIVHQTFFEPVGGSDKYPVLGRLAHSFELSGWEYRFYSDADIAAFLDEHFPASVKEAYDSLIPGAFKADLFRYCVLLIHGGLYADVDILLETTLDDAISSDAGFIAPIDDPGKQVGHRMCLWNGFMAAAPGHPFLAKAIELVVNQVRNRYTSLDVDASMCPEIVLPMLHQHDDLFLTGPCLLGQAVNRALGRHPQSNLATGRHQVRRLLGQVVILQHNKTDLGSQRMSDPDHSGRILCATALEANDGRDEAEHYSKSRTASIFGLERVYKDRAIVNQNIKVEVEI